LCLRFENGTAYFYEYSSGLSGQVSYTVQSTTINDKTISAIVVNTEEEDINISPLFHEGDTLYHYIMWFKAGTEELTDAELRILVSTSTCP